MKVFYAGDEEFAGVKEQLDAAGEEAYRTTADAVAGMCAGHTEDTLYDTLVSSGG